MTLRRNTFEKSPHFPIPQFFRICTTFSEQIFGFFEKESRAVSAERGYPVTPPGLSGACV